MPLPDKLIEIESTNLSAYAYDEEAKALYIKFRNTGEIWRYGQVPPEVVAAFAEAKSKGFFFAKEIKPKYEGLKIVNRPTVQASCKLPDGTIPESCQFPDCAYHRGSKKATA